MIKNTIFETIDNHENELVDLTKKIWDNPEIAYNEKFVSNLQREYLQSKGFIIKNVEGFGTAFIAEY
jgi:aminobenzoyl-glutamate utilization protein B